MYNRETNQSYVVGGWVRKVVLKEKEQHMVKVLLLLTFFTRDITKIRIHMPDTQ